VNVLPDPYSWTFAEYNDIVARIGDEVVFDYVPDLSDVVFFPPSAADKLANCNFGARPSLPFDVTGAEGDATFVRTVFKIDDESWVGSDIGFASRKGCEQGQKFKIRVKKEKKSIENDVYPNIARSSSWAVATYPDLVVEENTILAFHYETDDQDVWVSNEFPVSTKLTDRCSDSLFVTEVNGRNGRNGALWRASCPSGNRPCKYIIASSCSGPAGDVNCGADLPVKSHCRAGQRFEVIVN